MPFLSPTAPTEALLGVASIQPHTAGPPWHSRSWVCRLPFSNLTFCYTKKQLLSFKQASSPKSSLSSQRGCHSINRPVPTGLCCPAGRHFQVLVQRALSQSCERFVTPSSCSGPAHPNHSTAVHPKGTAGRMVFYHPCIHLVLGVRKKGTALHLPDHCQVRRVPAYH